MKSISVLTINREPENERDLVKIAEDARRYFPSKTWDDVRYLGKLSLKYDVKIASDGELMGAFLFERLTKTIKRIRAFHRLMDLLLAITSEPVVALYYFFNGKGFKRTLYFVHDYVDETVGIVSLYQVNEKSASKVVAHGLGHSRGLRHHLEPVDLMHPELLRTPALDVEGFCKVCLRKLTATRTERESASRRFNS
jgi:predicted Zn-dependent protease